MYSLKSCTENWPCASPHCSCRHGKQGKQSFPQITPYSDAFEDNVIQEAMHTSLAHYDWFFCVLFAIWQNRYNWQPRAGVFVVCFHIPLVTAASVWKLRGTCHSLQYHKNPTCYLKTCSEHTSLIKSSKTKPKRKKEEPDLGSLGQNSLFFKVHLLCSSKEKQSGDWATALWKSDGNTSPWPQAPFGWTGQNQSQEQTGQWWEDRPLPCQLLSTCVLPPVFPVYDPKEL